jgi:uncharacterized protein (TIGR02246 family)
LKTEDVSAIRGLEKAWCDAWNTHDMKALAHLLLPDADFVTVGGTWLRGREEFREHHALYHATLFKHSIFTVTHTSVKLLKSDLALTHIKWKMKGDFDPDGTPRKPRTGIFTQVLQKSKGRWLILASQNTNDVRLSGKSVKELLRGRQWDQSFKVGVRPAFKTHASDGPRDSNPP